MIVKIGIRFFIELMVFLSGSVKMGGASPTGSVKKITKIRPGQVRTISSFLCLRNRHTVLILIEEEPTRLKFSFHNAHWL